jgi:hypothetical protein
MNQLQQSINHNRLSEHDTGTFGGILSTHQNKVLRKSLNRQTLNINQNGLEETEMSSSN